MPPRRPQSKKMPSKPAVQKSVLAAGADSEAEENFKVELHWCLQNIEAALQKASLKEKDDLTKARQTLTSKKALHVKKRQVMRALFGDYRAKMAQEETKVKIDVPQMKKNSVLPKTSKFIRKSAMQSSSLTTTDKQVSITDEEPYDNKDNCGNQEVTTDKSPEAENKDSGTCGTKSTPDSHAEEFNVSSGEGTDSMKDFSGNLLRTDTEGDKRASVPLKFSRSGNTFKFNFSVPS